MNIKQSIFGSSIAFLIATSCCWLPTLIISLSGASGLMAFSNRLEQFSPIFMVISLGLLLFGTYQLYLKKLSSMKSKSIQLESTITCSNCSHQENEIMPTNACQYFYECKNCNKILKPKAGDCCVYCSYGTIACPPIQSNQNCC